MSLRLLVSLKILARIKLNTVDHISVRNQCPFLLLIVQVFNALSDLLRDLDLLRANSQTRHIPSRDMKLPLDL